jgi:mRNA-degrading endonuclease toxin of MazEF toxin-antitoxin module
MPSLALARWFPQRGEICRVRLDKDRPALVISSNALNRHALDICVVPVTSVEHRRFALRVELHGGVGGFTRRTWDMCDKNTTLEKTLVKYPPLGRLSARALSRVECAIKTALELS